MATIQKTQGIELIGLQQLNANSVIKSLDFDVSTKLSASIFIHFALIDTAGALSSGVEFRIEASAKSTGDDQWFPLVSYRTSVTAPISKPVSGTLTSGSSLIAITNTSGLSAGNIIFIRNSTLSNSEWARIKLVTTNTNINIIDPLKNTQTGSTVFTAADLFVSQIDLTAIGRIRLVADASNTNRNTVVEVNMVTGDSIS